MLWAYVEVSALEYPSAEHSGADAGGSASLADGATALSVDAWRHAQKRSVHGRYPQGPRYGYSVWVPGLDVRRGVRGRRMGQADSASGLDKLGANGTVKYHFITDSVNAPVQWGLQLARHPWLAVLASFLAIATESLVVTAAFIRNDWYRFAMGVGAACLIAGFGVFMGVFWPGWWVPLLAFLPWEGSELTQHAACRRRLQPARLRSRDDLGAAQLIMIGAVIAQQIVVSAMRLERAPMFSWYDMYSGTYASPAAFAARDRPGFESSRPRSRGNVELARLQPPRRIRASVRSGGGRFA